MGKYVRVHQSDQLLRTDRRYGCAAQAAVPRALGVRTGAGADPAGAAGGSRPQLHHGRARRRRRDAELSVDLLPRPALHPRPARAEARAPVRRWRGVQPQLVLAAAVQMGFHIDRFAMVVVVLVAALPSASNVALLTERFGADTGRVAMIILVTTAAAFFTFSGAVALLNG